MNKSVKIKAYGKLNLFLDITGVRDDGYHLLKTVMQSVSVFDLLTFEMSDGSGIELICDYPGFPLDNHNLIWKAIEAFLEFTNTKLDKKITVNIQKNIPSMAGMAGGSSDCAAALVAMNHLFDKNFNIETLCQIGVNLGADVPFTLTGGTVLCEGIGEKLTILPTPNNLYFAVVKPEVSISTPQAYKIYDTCEHQDKKIYSDFEIALEENNTEKISHSIFNALEVAADFNEISKAKDDMIRFGALNSMMTGSGSAVFGIFKNENDAKKCLGNMDNFDFKKVLRTMDHGWEILK